MTGKLSLRREPTQARARHTFNTLLSVTAELLEEVGFEAFNTNLLANRSGIGTRAIYRYFPNKYALVSELARRMSARWRENLTLITVQNSVTWPDVWPLYLDAYVAAVRDTPGGVALLQAMRVHPELRAVDDEVNTRYVAETTAALRHANKTLTRNQARLTATLLLKSTIAIIDTLLDENRSNAKRMLDMLKAMHLTLLREQLAR